MKALENIRENWMLITFLGSLIIGWTMFNARLTAVEAEYENAGEVLDAVVDMRTDIAVMQNDISYIKKQVSEIAEEQQHAKE